MAAEERPVRTWSAGSLNLTVLLLIIALLCYIAALCFAEGWLTKGNWQEWIAGGLISATLAKLV